jgi:hypothetical protein
MIRRPSAHLIVLSLAALTLVGCQDGELPLAPAPRGPAPQLSLSQSGQLDQENLSSNTSAGTGGIYLGQSFTAGSSGQLGALEVQIICQYNMPDAVLEVYAGAYDVYSTDFAYPVVSPAPIASQPVSSSTWPSCYTNPFAAPTWIGVTFDTPAPVVAGQPYTFRFTCPTCASGQINHPMGDANPYAGGSAFTWSTYDIVFRTYVSVSTVSYAFTGFFAPVDPAPTLNSTKAGSAVPVKFSLGGNQGLAILAAGSPASQPISCAASVPVDAIEETVTAGGSSLTYDAPTDRYTYVWKTDKAWTGTCRTLSVKLVDGSVHAANFQFTK